MVERNNHGQAVLAYLGYVKDCPPIYEQRGLAGWLTTAASRPVMIEQLGAALLGEPGIFSSSRLLAECRTFVRQGDGRVEAAAGVHDDCVMAMAIGVAGAGGAEDDAVRIPGLRNETWGTRRFPFRRFASLPPFAQNAKDGAPGLFSWAMVVCEG